MSSNSKENLHRTGGAQRKKKEWDNSRYLSLDEFANHKGNKDFKTTVVDVEKHQLLEVIDSHKAEDICKVLEKLPAEKRLAVEAVSIDMWGAFAKVIKEMFPHAKIVYDHFHIIQNINKDLNKLRKMLKAKRKGLKYLLMKNREDLSEAQKKELQTHLSDFPILAIAVEMKEELREIYRTARTSTSGKNRLESWLRYGKLFFQDSAQSIERHLEGDCNYFDHRISNGITEGINRE